MQYQNVEEAEFCERLNRFVARVRLNGTELLVHVKNTGRCRELLVPGCKVFLSRSDRSNRKTAYDLIAVQKGNLLINMDAQAPNRLFFEWVQTGNFLDGITAIRPEYCYGASRLDFYLEQGSIQHLVEVKGVTLEENRIARFPDAPTVRGVKHLHELSRAVQEGYESWLCFVVQMQGMSHVEPNNITHPAFGEALREAVDRGVHVLALECSVKPDVVEIVRRIPVIVAPGSGCMN